MNSCPFHTVRPGLPPIPARIAKLPVDERGYPVPFFVQFVDGKPDFRIADGRKWRRCVKESLCWVCGEPLSAFKAFVIGPMCAINKTTGDPGSHKECALWSVRACPFLTKPKMVRREDELTEECKANVSGFMLERNPGVSLVWVTKSFRLFPDHNGKALIELGDPAETSWWREGRPATRFEILESIESGLPALDACCAMESTPNKQKEAREELARRKAYVISKLLPA